MESLIKDEFIVLKKSLIPDYDISLTVYFRKQGKESIYIPKGQMLKSPYIYYSEPFSWCKGVFNLRRNNIYIEEIYNHKNLSLEFTKDLKKLYTGSFFLTLFIKYVSFPDEKLFILLKKALYYLTNSKSPIIDKLNFLVKFIMLNGLLPDFRYCQRCGVILNEKNFYGIDQNLISPVCKNCREKGDKFYLSYRDIVLIEKLKKVKFKELEKIKIEQKKIKKLIQFLNLYMKNSF